jgi:hypothetical protein
MFLASALALCLFPGFDIQPLHADFTFGPPANVTVTQRVPSISADGLELYFDSPGPADDYDLSVATRASVRDEWGNPMNLGPLVNSASIDATPRLSPDGLALYFASNRPGGYGQFDLWVTTRPSKEAPWENAVNLGSPVNTLADEICPSVTDDGLELYFSEWKTYRTGGYGRQDIWVATRPTTNHPWGEPMNLGPPVNTSDHDGKPAITPDGLVMFVKCYNRAGEYGEGDIWMTRRATREAEWGVPVNLGPGINTAAEEDLPYISPDGSTLYFLRQGTGALQAPVLPVVDFNGDGKVNGKDLVILMEHWGESDSVCDIGPYAWGDGIVDVNDVIVLADYIGPELVDPTLVAHWALDEGAGSVAIDWAGEHYAMIVGDVVWEPNGVVDGALTFDGQENFMRTTAAVLDPATGPLSVIAWVKGGGPNRVIVSQFGGADWLYLNQYGMLTTDLKASGQDGTSLTSDAWLLDDQWHRVALVWDGTNRALRVDGVEVATDTQPNLAASSGSLQIGTGKDRAADTFWTGLMDDIRVYRRATRP